MRHSKYLGLDLSKYIENQRHWSLCTFGEGKRTVGIGEHIKKEINEVYENPDSPNEWIDIVILALDGAWRTGATTDRIIERLAEKQAINFKRKFQFPVGQDEVSEHIKDIVED